MDPLGQVLGKKYIGPNCCLCLNNPATDIMEIHFSIFKINQI